MWAEIHATYMAATLGLIEGQCYPVHSPSSTYSMQPCPRLVRCPQSPSKAFRSGYNRAISHHWATCEPFGMRRTWGTSNLPVCRIWTSDLPNAFEWQCRAEHTAYNIDVLDQAVFVNALRVSINASDLISRLRIIWFDWTVNTGGCKASEKGWEYNRKQHFGRYVKRERWWRLICEGRICTVLLYN